MFVIGRVVDPDGKPVPRARVMAYAAVRPSGNIGTIDAMAVSPIGWAIADGSGRFRIEADRLTPPGDVPALTRSIFWAASNRPALREMGCQGRASIQNATHKEMHRYRHRLLREAIDARRPLASERP